MAVEFDAFWLGNAKLDRAQVLSYRNVCQKMVVAIRTNMSNKNSNRFTDSKFNDWKAQILKDLDTTTFQPNKQILVRGINILLEGLNLQMSATKAGFVVLRTDVVDVKLDKDSVENIISSQTEAIINNTLSYNNDLALADMKIEQGTDDTSLEEDGLLFLILIIVFINGGKMKYITLENTMERFVDLFKTGIGAKRLNFSDYMQSLNSSGYIKMYDGDRDMQEVKQSGTTIERCIRIGPSALPEITPFTIARFIGEIKGMSISEVLGEHADLNKIVKEELWGISGAKDASQNNETAPSNTQADDASQRVAKRRREDDLSHEDEPASTQNGRRKRARF